MKICGCCSASFVSVEVEFSESDTVTELPLLLLYCDCAIITRHYQSIKMHWVLALLNCLLLGESQQQQPRQISGCWNRKRRSAEIRVVDGQTTDRQSAAENILIVHLTFNEKKFCWCSHNSSRVWQQWPSVQKCLHRKITIFFWWGPCICQHLFICVSTLIDCDRRFSPLHSLF